MSKFKIVGIIAALALVATVAIPAQAASLTSAQVSAIVSLLQSFGADAATVANVQATLTGGTVTPTTGGSSMTFVSDLTVGSTGAEVSALQAKLGSLVTGYFGPITKAALASWQSAHGISPAVGYFGPVTRAAMNAGSVVTPGTTVPPVTTTGVEGTLSVSTNPSPSSGKTIYEGDTSADVLGLKVEAKLSDIRVERVKVVLGSSSTVYNKVFSRIYVKDGSTVVASSDLNSDTVVKESDGTYTITLTGLNVVAPKDGTKVLTIAVDVRPSLSTTYHTNYTFYLPTDGVRGIDGAGINQYAGTSSVTRTFAVAAELAESATLQVSTGSNTPAANMIIAADGSTTDEKDNVTLLTFDLRAQKDAVLVTDLTATIAKTGTGAATATTAYLYDGGTLIGSASINSATGLAYFSDIDLTVPKDVTKTLTLSVDIKDANTTVANLSASISTGTPDASTAGIAAENSTGSNVAETGSATGNTMIVLSKGPQFTLVSKSIVGGATASQNNTATSTLTAVFNIKVKAIGGDVTFGTQAASSTFTLAPYQSGTILSTTAASSTSWSAPSSGVVTSGLLSTDSFKLQQNNEVTIPVTFVVEGRTAAGALLGTTPTALGLTSIKWSTTDYTTVSSTFMAGKSEWITDYKTFGSN